MVHDKVYELTKGKQIVEVLIDNMWIPAMATDLRILNRNLDLKRVTAIRYKNIEKETK